MLYGSIFSSLHAPFTFPLLTLFEFIRILVYISEDRQFCISSNKNKIVYYYLVKYIGRTSRFNRAFINHSHLCSPLHILYFPHVSRLPVTELIK